MGRPHTTIRGWIKADFPRLFKKLGDAGTGNASPIGRNDDFVSLDQQRIAEAQEAARTLQQIADVLTTADARGELVAILEGTLHQLRQSGKAIAFSDF